MAGPGPGDPRDRDDPRIAALHTLVGERLAAGTPLLAVCLSHQVLASLLGLPVVPLPTPHQGTQRTVNLFGTAVRVAHHGRGHGLGRQRHPPGRAGHAHRHAPGDGARPVQGGRDPGGGAGTLAGTNTAFELRAGATRTAKNELSGYWGYGDWIAEREQTWRDQVRFAGLDPFRGYATALRGQLPDAVRVLDAFHDECL